MPEINDEIQGRISEMGPAAPTQQELIEKAVTKATEKVTRKRVQGKGKTGQVGGSLNQIMKGYEDKIALLLYADGGKEPEAMGKEARELFLQYQKDKQALKDKFIEKIQKL